MAVGDVTGGGNAKKSVCLMHEQTQATGAPTDNSNMVGSGGVPMYPTNKITAEDGHCYTACPATSSTLHISSTAGSGTMTGTFKLWLYLNATGKWYPRKVNGGNAISETDSDVIRYEETFNDLGHYDAVFLELSSPGGNATEFEAWLTTSRTVSY